LRPISASPANAAVAVNTAAMLRTEMNGFIAILPILRPDLPDQPVAKARDPH
jgi:hypothetical protein